MYKYILNIYLNKKIIEVLKAQRNILINNSWKNVYKKKLLRLSRTVSEKKCFFGSILCYELGNKI